MRILPSIISGGKLVLGCGVWVGVSWGCGVRGAGWGLGGCGVGVGGVGGWRQATIDTLVTKCSYPRLAVKSKSRNSNILWFLTLLTGHTTTEWFKIYPMVSEMPPKSMVNTTELRLIFPLRKNKLRHVVECDGSYPRAMTPNGNNWLHSLWIWIWMKTQTNLFENIGDLRSYLN